MTEDEERGIEWIEAEFEPEDFNTFEEYLQAIRDEFQNDNFITDIQLALFDIFEGAVEEQTIESNIESFMRAVFG